MSTCQACGHEYPADSKFCTGCGAAAAPPVQGQSNSCPACGAGNPSQSKFCIQCGAPFQTLRSSPPSNCPACGAGFSPGGKFCPGCGATVAAAPETAPSGRDGIADTDRARASLEGFLAGLEARLVQGGFFAEAAPSSPSLDRLYRRKKLDIAKAGMLTTVCGIKIIPSGVDAARIRQFSEAVFKFATAGKGVLVRNTFQPVLAYPVIITAAYSADVEAFLNSYWPKHMMAYEYPVVIAASTGQAAMHRSTPVWAMALHGGIKKEAESLFTP